MHLIFWLLLPIVSAVLVFYPLSYLIVLGLYDKNAPQRKLVARYLCCWRDVYLGKSVCFWNCVCSPFVLLVHSFRIYCAHCAHILCRRVYWLTLGRCTDYFTDEAFKPDCESFGEVSGLCVEGEDIAELEANSQVVWARAMNFSKQDVRQKPRHPHLRGTDEMCLFDGVIEPKEMLRDSPRDAWLLIAISELSQHEGAVNRLFFTPEINPRGKYRLRMYDPLQEAWKVIDVDDHIPCFLDVGEPDYCLRGDSGLPVPVFAPTLGKAVWHMILEKAFAKILGSYAALEDGSTEWALVCMTGGKACRFELASTGRWARSEMICMNDPDNKGAVFFKPTKEQHRVSELFELLRFHHRNGAVLLCGGATGAGMIHGLPPRQTFTILQVRTVRKNWSSDQFLRMVQVRNLSHKGEWSGPWCDNSELWNQYAFIKGRLGFEHTSNKDGTYWMQWENFCENFSHIGVVDLNMGIDKMWVPIHKESMCCGPIASFIKGCCNFWCCCAGWRRYISHEKPTSEEMAELGYASKNCGGDPSGMYCRLCEFDAVHFEEGPHAKAVRDYDEWYGVGKKTLEKKRSKDADPVLLARPKTPQSTRSSSAPKLKRGSTWSGGEAQSSRPPAAKAAAQQLRRQSTGPVQPRATRTTSIDARAALERLQELRPSSTRSGSQVQLLKRGSTWSEPAEETQPETTVRSQSQDVGPRVARTRSQERPKLLGSQQSRTKSSGKSTPTAKEIETNAEQEQAAVAEDKDVIKKKVEDVEKPRRAKTPREPEPETPQDAQKPPADSKCFKREEEKEKAKAPKTPVVREPEPETPHPSTTKAAASATEAKGESKCFSRDEAKEESPSGSPACEPLAPVEDGDEDEEEAV